MTQTSPDRNRPANGEVFSFGEFELNPGRGMLLKNGVELPLRRQCFQVLQYLIQHQGVLVSKQELMDAVWADVIVTESSLTQCILTIRRVLDDDSKTILRSIPRGGYLFDLAVTVRSASPPEAVVAPRPKAPRPGRWSLGIAAACLLALVVFVYALTTNTPESGNPAASAPSVKLSENVPVTTSNEDALRRYQMGKLLHGRRAPGDLERAIEQFRTAVEIDPGFTDAWVGLAGSLWTFAGEQPSLWGDIREEMRQALERTLALDPNHPEANARIARYYWEVNQDELAVQHFERAVEFGQDSPQVLSFAAGFAFRDFNYGAAVEIQRRVTALDPLNFVYQVNLALFLRYAGRLEESIAAYKIAFDLNPEAATDYREDYLVIFLLNGRIDQAETLALQLPDGPAHDHQLAMVYLALNLPSRSEEMIRRLSADHSVDTALRLAEYYAYAGEIDLSFHWLEQARNRHGGMVLHSASNTYFEVFLHSPFLQPLAQDARWQPWRTYLEDQLRKPVMSINTNQLVLTNY